MPRIKDLQRRQCISWCRPDGFSGQGVVFGRTDDHTVVIPVSPCKAGQMFYNGESMAERDANYLVLLKDCPPPFNGVCKDGYHNRCYAIADPKREIKFSDAQLMSLNARVYADFLSVRDEKAIMDCRQAGALEKQFSHSEAKKLVRDTIDRTRPELYSEHFRNLLENMQAESDDDDFDFDI